MRLPEPEEVKTESARLLYAHDVVEYHCADARNFYSQMYKSRLGLLLGLAQRAGERGRVLDLGCAQGNVALLLAEAGMESWAVDLRCEFLEYAGRKHERGKFRRCAANAEALPFADDAFELVVWGEMIEHVAYPEKVLGEIRRVLRPGGHLVLSTPNGRRLHTGLPTFGQVADRAALVTKQFKPDSDGHLFLFAQGELEALLGASGFRLRVHRYYGTPWLTGRLGFRHWMRWMPPRWRQAFDQFTLNMPGISRVLAEGQVLLAQNTDGAAG
ncbi:MAG: class I SAM-dependent methyltransferase [Acidobacteria bacterium]|nr:class I SAM-dependent methyltransferase [Acidobacteriota bacterium]